ncbi:MAG: DMT family transporter [Rubrivivax sp.]
MPNTAAAAARRAIALMVGACACFATNDALVKFVSQSLPTAQVIVLRSLIAAALILLVALRTGATREWRAALGPRVLARSAADACGTSMYLLSLFHLPLANATAINLAAPVFMTLLAVLLLGERASAARWAAVGIGFAGVLAVVQPAGDSFNAWALLCVAGTLLHAVRDLVTRRIDRAVPSLMIALSSAVALGLAGGAMLPWQGWQPVAGWHLALLAAAAALLTSAYLMLIGSLRRAEISLTAPFRYSALLFAALLGYGVWGQVPDAWAWAGIALLVGSGLSMVHGERGRRPTMRA